jgi:hypothetical protein
VKPIDRLLFAQGGMCFFCQQPLSSGDASVEHLVATSNGGSNAADNCVACCKALNALMGNMSLKDKIRVILNQRGQFKCPNGAGSARVANSVDPQNVHDKVAFVLADLRKRGATRPRTVKTLTNTVNALFQKQLTELELASLLDRLQVDGVVSVNGTKVSYELPPSTT